MKRYTLLWTSLLALSYPALSQDTLYVDAASTHTTKTDTEVGQSWTKAYKYLDTAIHYASASDHIWVKQGTYTPGGTNSTADSRYNLAKSGLQIYGGFAGHETDPSQRASGAKSLLSGDIGTKMADHTNIAASNAAFTDNVIQIVRITAANIRLDGFIIQHAAGITPVNLKQHPQNSSHSPELYQTDNNTHTSNGGAIYSAYSTTLLSNLEVRYNHAFNGAGIYMNAGGTIQNCDIHHNRMEPWWTKVSNVWYRGGGAVYVKEGFSLINSKIHYNEHGFGSSGLEIEDNRFTGGNGTPIVYIIGCAIYKNTNTSSRGSPRKDKNDQPLSGSLSGRYESSGAWIEGLFRIRNCTFYNNKVMLSSYKHFQNTGEKAHNYITNSIFYSDFDNNSSQIYRRVVPHGSEVRVADVVFLNNVLRGAFTDQTCPKWGAIEVTDAAEDKKKLAPKFLKADKSTLVGVFDVVGPTETGAQLFASISHPYATRDSVLYLHLKSGSAAVDAGLDTAVPSSLTEDIDGLQRKIGTVDIGAFEYKGASVATPLTWVEGGEVDPGVPAGTYIGHLTSNLPGTPKDTFYLSADTDSGGFVIKGDRVYAGADGAPATSNRYDITVANGFLGDWVTGDLSVVVGVVIENIALSGTATVASTAGVGTEVGTLSATTTPTRAITFSVPDADLFDVDDTDDTKLVLKRAIVNSDASPYSVIVRITSGSVTKDHTFQITISRASITAMALTATTVPWDAPANYKIGKLSSTVTPSGTALSYAVTPTATFAIGGTNNDSLLLKATPASGHTSYTASVTATGGGASYQKDFTITVSRSSISSVSLSSLSVPWDAPANYKIGKLSAAISPSASVSYTVTPTATFGIGGAANDSLLLKATPASGHTSYTASVVATGGGATRTQAFTITVSRATISAIALTSTSVRANSPAETVIGTLSATVNPDDTNVTFSVPNNDANFKIVGTEIRLKRALGSEDTGSLTVSVTATGGGGTLAQSLTITITDVSISAIALDNKSVPWNAQPNHEIGTLSATVDPSNTPITYTVTPTASFGIGGSGNNKLLLKVTPASDVNSYAASVTANGGGANTSATFTITVTRATITAISLSANTVPWNAQPNHEIGTLSATVEPDNTDITYSVEPEATFAISNTGNKLLLKSTPNANTNSFTANVSAMGGGATRRTQSFTINVSRATISALTLDNQTVPPNSAADYVVGTLSATVTPATTPLTFSVPDNEQIFKVDGTSLKLKRALTNTDTGPFSVSVTAAGGGVTKQETFRITISNVRISALKLSFNQVPVGAAAKYEIGTLSATVTPAGTKVTYSVTRTTRFLIGGESNDKLLLKDSPTKEETLQATVKAEAGGVVRTNPFVIKILDASKFLSTSAFPSLYVYPNPTTGLIRVSGLQLDDQVALYTLDGQRVNRTIHRKTQALDISDWPDGTYLIRVLSKEALRPKFSGLVVKKTQ